MFNNNRLVRSLVLFVLMGCSVTVLADTMTCPPAGQVPSNWTPMGAVSSSEPFLGAMYGMFGPTAMSCKYSSNPSDPMGGYILVSNFGVRKPNPNTDPNWQNISGYLTCVSSNIESCKFTAAN